MFFLYLIFFYFLNINSCDEFDKCFLETTSIARESISTKDDIRYALHSKNIPNLLRLMSKGSNVNLKSKVDGETLIFLAVRMRSLFITQILLESQKVKINEINNNGFTPLDIAQQLYESEIETELCRYGAQNGLH